MMHCFRYSRFWLLSAALVVYLVVPESSGQDSSIVDRANRLLRELIFNVTRPNPVNIDSYLQRLGKLNRTQKVMDTPFPCSIQNGRSPIRPTSVHRLRPGDIDVIAAMGDSIAAGYAILATNVFQIFVESRGQAWSGGGEKTWREYLTLPNILKEFNPKLVGYSYGDSLFHQEASQFNIGEGMAMSRDMLFQAQILLKRIQRDKRVDFYNDWKLVTLMMGTNDFCSDMCYINNPNIIENHRSDLMKALDFLRDNMPRTLVNLVSPLNMEVMANFTNKPSQCNLMHNFECSCIFGLPHQQLRESHFEIMRQWQQVEMEVAASDRYLTKEDFAVVFQPFTVNASFPTAGPGASDPDYSYLSVDCFHFGQKSHAMAANALWNNMLQPVGSKSFNWTVPFTKFLCPTKEHPYIYTAANSKTEERS